MALREEFETTGNWLFKRRSYLPVFVIGVYLIFLTGFGYPGSSRAPDRLWEIFCAVVSLLGLGIRIFTIGHKPQGTSGRNTNYQEADVLNTAGMYSVVRHPLYLGNFFIWLGVSLFARNPYFAVVVIMIFWLYYERIMFAEEEFLRKKFGDVFLRWAGITPAFFPKFGNWRPADLPFSFKTVLKKESSSFFGVISSFTFFKFAGGIYTEKRIELDAVWLVIFAAGLALYIILIILKKKKLLDADGR